MTSARALKCRIYFVPYLACTQATNKLRLHCADYSGFIGGYNETNQLFAAGGAQWLSSVVDLRNLSVP